jgi:hypothetical protein
MISSISQKNSGASSCASSVRQLELELRFGALALLANAKAELKPTVLIVLRNRKHMRKHIPNILRKPNTPDRKCW